MNTPQPLYNTLAGIKNKQTNKQIKKQQNKTKTNKQNNNNKQKKKKKKKTY